MPQNYDKYRKFGEVRDGKPFDTDGRLIEDCIESVPDGGRFVTSHNCGWKLKGDTDYPYLCGLHVSARNRAKDRENKRVSARIQINEEFETATQELVKINDQLGITSMLETRSATTGVEAFIYRPTGNAIVPIEKLRELAAQLDNLRGMVAQLDEEVSRWQRIDANGTLG